MHVAERKHGDTLGGCEWRGGDVHARGQADDERAALGVRLEREARRARERQRGGDRLDLAALVTLNEY